MCFFVDDGVFEFCVLDDCVGEYYGFFEDGVFDYCVGYDVDVGVDFGVCECC